MSEISTSDVLQIIYDHFRETAEWPKYQELEIDLHEHGRLPDLLGEIDEELIGIEDPYQKNAVCYLTLRGIAECERGQEDIENVLAVAQYFAARYIEARTEVEVTSDELQEELGLIPEEIRRLCTLFYREGWGLTGGGSYAEDRSQCRLRVRSRALEFRDVSTLEEFFQRKAAAEKKELDAAELSRRGSWLTRKGSQIPRFAAPDTRTVFLIHGRDEENLLRLRNLLETEFDLSVVVMKNEPGLGRTLIEKFEDEAKKAGFALALVTPDDLVEVDEGSYAQARPNVVFEIGWFYGRLGRDSVCILFQEGTKIHTDLEGVSRIEFKKSVEETVIDLRRELQGVGLVP